MAGTIVANTLNTDTGIFSTNNAYSGIANAWVNFTGSSGTVNGSFNISSVTRVSTGLYTINFTNALTDANYAIIGTIKPTTAQTNTTVSRSILVYYNTTPSTSSFQVITLDQGTGVQDYDKLYVAIHR
jgi:hypothetical protein